MSDQAPAQTSNAQATAAATGTTEATNQGTAPVADSGQSHAGEVLEEFLPDGFLDRKVKQKINGKEEARTVKEWLAHASKGIASGEKFESASKMRKEAEMIQRQYNAFLEALDKDPLSTLERVLPKEKLQPYLEHHIKQYMEYQKLPEPERQRRKFEEEKMTFEQQRQQWEAQQQEAYVAQEAQQLQSQYLQEFPQALEAHGLDVQDPENRDRLIRRMAYVANRELSAGREFTPESAAAIVAQEEKVAEAAFQKMLRARIAAAKDDDSIYSTLTESLGDEVLNRFRKADISRVTKMKGQPRQQEQAPQSRRVGEQRKIRTTDELRELMERRRGG